MFGMAPERKKEMKKLWMITGSQHLYGEDTLRQVAADAGEIAAYLDRQTACGVACRPIVTTAEEITEALAAANAEQECIGVITWMHTFSPSKMWIQGLQLLQKPVLHLHTQMNRSIPYDSIDMDFMNLNQSAHGDREHGFLYARLGKRRKVVAGYWKDRRVIEEIDVFAKAALGWDQSKSLKVCRFGDNMREVAVTEGNKVTAQMKLGWSVNGYGTGELAAEIGRVTPPETDALMKEYDESYTIVTKDLEAVRVQASYELGIRRFLEKGGFGAFTTTFEDLHGLKQLPGLAVQRLMAEGYGFGAEGDWKTAALLRVMKVMAGGRATAFMEDYTYHLAEGNEMILGAHMLEVCPSIATSDIKIDVQPLDIGNRQPPARMIFDGMTGSAICASLIELGGRFRLIVAEVEGVKKPREMPRLPVAGAMWVPKPDFYSGLKAWLLAGGAHHTVLSFALTKEHLKDFARMADIECIVIDDKTDVERLENDLMLSELLWKARG